MVGQCEHAGDAGKNLSVRRWQGGELDKGGTMWPRSTRGHASTRCLGARRGGDASEVGYSWASSLSGWHHHLTGAAMVRVGAGGQRQLDATLPER
jgi:hypothetical protein